VAANRYYWLKLKRDFFKRHDIRIIEEMPNGKDYILFYLKMLLESIDHGGALRFSETIPYNEQMLSVITNTNIDLVRSAMKVFIQLKMIEVLDDETIYMSEVQKMTGSESTSAERVRKHRAALTEKPRLLQSNADVTKCNTEKDKEIEKDTELDTETEKECGAAAPTPTPARQKPVRHKHGEYGWVRLTQDEHARLLSDLGPEELHRCIKYVDESAQSNGNKNKWRDWNLVIRRCWKQGWGLNAAAAQAGSRRVDALGVLNQMLQEGP
jgi:predicted phage replisome organizer